MHTPIVVLLVLAVLLLEALELVLVLRRVDYIRLLDGRRVCVERLGDPLGPGRHARYLGRSGDYYDGPIRAVGFWFFEVQIFPN